jgi:hypothetical protein
VQCSLNIHSTAAKPRPLGRTTIDMRAIPTILLSSLCLILSPLPTRGQVPSESGTLNGRNRYPFQTFVEDSSHVYWTWYPNPFSPPTVTTTTAGVIQSGLTLYCDLCDTVSVALLGDRDSVIYSSRMITLTPPHFDVAFTYAGPRYADSLLPARYFRSQHDGDYKVAISVKGRRKCVREQGIFMRKDWYCWLAGSEMDK